jgi:hypothetical protein
MKKYFSLTFWKQFFILWWTWGSITEAWQDACTINSDKFQNSLKEIEDEFLNKENNVRS